MLIAGFWSKRFVCEAHNKKLTYLLNPNVIVAVSKSMRVVQRCSNEILMGVLASTY